MSSTTESLTQKWLRQNIQSYVHKDTVFVHVDAVLARHPSIRPKTDIYTYDDGRTQLLLCIHGLLPISYRGASYNIPIAVWITKDYPRQPPIAYVVPTSDMLVRAGKYVDVSGRCQVEYSQNWERKSEGCSLSALLEAMQIQFAREPPVYAKPKQTSEPRPSDRHNTVGPDYSLRPAPPIPATQPPLPAPSQSPSASRGNDDRPPPLPVKPSPSATTSYSTPAISAAPSQLDDRSKSPIVHSTSALAARPPPPLPPHPPTLDTSLQQHRNSPVPPQYIPYGRPPIAVPGLNSPVLSSWSPAPRQADLAHPAIDSQARTSTPHAHGHPYAPIHQTSSPTPITSPQTIASSEPPLPPQTLASPPRATQPQPQPLQPPISPLFISPHATGHQSPQPQPYPSNPPVAQQPPPFVHSQISTSLPPAPPPPPPIPPVPPAADLLDDDEAISSQVSPPTAPTPAPPRPPNPELLRLHSQVHAKLTSELASLSQAMALDAERLRAHQADLLAGEPAIRDEMARLEAVRDVCRTVAGRMKGVVAEAERNVAELRRKGDPEVDELVCSTTIVHDQLINLVAEDNAIEDTIYHLHRALNTGRVDLERFLRTTRVLAEEQFMKRALIDKILHGIPMGGSLMPSSSDWA